MSDWLLSETLPRKTRQLHLSSVETSLAEVLSDGPYLAQDPLDHARGHDHASRVREQDVLEAGRVLLWAGDRAHRVQRPRDVGDLPPAANFSSCPFEARFAAAVAPDGIAACASEVMPVLVVGHDDVAREPFREDNVGD